MKMDEEINILDYVKVIIKWKDLIASFIIILIVLIFIISLALPRNYKAETVLLIPQQSGKGIEGIIALSSMMTGSSVNMPANLTQSLIGRTTNFSDILKSKTIAEMIVDGLSLQRHYPGAKKDGLIAMVRKKIKVKEQRGILRISVIDRDPRLAADIANYSVLALDEFNKKGNIQFTKRIREFIREQLAMAKVDLSDAEEKFKKYETQSQMVKMSEKELMLGRLMREVKVREAIYTMLMQEYEKTKLDEAKEELFFEVLDPAKTPRSPSSPRPVLYLFFALFMGGMAAVFLAFFFEYLEGLGVKVPMFRIWENKEWQKTLKFWIK